MGKACVSGLDEVLFKRPALHYGKFERGSMSSRLKDRIRVLWVDATCISQQDINERYQQVGLLDARYI